MDWDAFATEMSVPFRDALNRHAVPRRLGKGELLFDQGEHDDRMFILERGLLEVNVISESGKRLALNQLRPKSVFGEIALFDPGLRTARVEALQASELRAIGHAKLMGEIRTTPEIAVELMRLAGLRMRWIAAQVEEQVFRPPTARLAGKILYLMDNEGRVLMSQAQMAEFVGVTREAVSKILAEWRRLGIVELSRGTIQARDQGALRQIETAFV